jgi:carboxylate-amine ligase
MVVITVFPHPSPAATTGPTRTFGVEEELLLVDAVTLEPAAAGPDAVDAHAAGVRSSPATAPAHQVTTELQQEQIEVASPPLTGLTEQIAAIRQGRRLADAAARAVGARAVALASPVTAGAPHLVPAPRFRWLQERFGLVAAEQLTCGLHVHVGVGSREEGVAVLDRIRVWLPVLLALSGNSPFWYGRESGFSSYRYQAWVRWPTSGPTEVFGSVEEHDRQREALLRSGVPLDLGMIYFDARLSHHLPTVEVRIADVCLFRDDALLVAALVRAMVDTAARDWRAGTAAPPADTSVLRLATWRAGRSGLEGDLLDPIDGRPLPARQVLADLVEHVGEALADNGDGTVVADLLEALLDRGTGALHQRRWLQQNHHLGAMVLRMAELTTS